MRRLLSAVWPVTPRHRGARSVTVTEHLEGLTDCPEDLYLIEGIRSHSMTACSALMSWKKR